VRWLLLAAALVALSGCAINTEYKAADDKGFGFQERLLEDGRFVLIIRHPAVGKEAAATARSYFDRRAAELCAGKSFEKNIFRAERPTIRTDSYGSAAPGWFELEGYVKCAEANA
jgi:hypothetical protein